MSKRYISRALSALLALIFALSSLLLLVSCGQEESGWSYTRDKSLPDFATQVKLNTAGLDSDFERKHSLKRMCRC